MPLLLKADVAFAHGSATFPASRTYTCYVNGLAGGQGGDLDPTNPACADAVATGGKTALWNWFGNLISDADGRHREIIPDGKLCGPTPTYDAYNMGRTDWPTTRLESGQSITVRFNAWAPHPGTWWPYITKDGWDPNQPLGWDDIEPFDEPVTNPPINSSGPHGAEYSWSAQLPNKSGRHIIYFIWQRSDSPEAFYSCSDVIFGEDPEYPFPGDGGGDGDDEPPEPGEVSCSVEYQSNDWNNGFTADVTLTNTGSDPIGGWTVDWSFTAGQQVTNAWNAEVSQDGAEVSASNAGWNSTISPNSSVSFGFQGTHNGSNPPPDQFEVNNTLCT